MALGAGDPDQLPAAWTGKSQAQVTDERHVASSPELGTSGAHTPVADFEARDTKGTPGVGTGNRAWRVTGLRDDERRLCSFAGQRAPLEKAVK
jgi:hypothetical protein